MTTEAQTELEVAAESAGQRLDQYIAATVEGVSRSRAQALIDEGRVTVDGKAEKASLKLRGGERVAITGDAAPEPTVAQAEEIPLDIVYEDKYLAVVNKPAGMMVHAGAGSTPEARGKGTLANALLGHYKQLSTVGGELRPGIVHRLDKETSGLIVIARDDETHEALAAMFSEREMKKTYVALVHGVLKQDKGTVNAAIGRDLTRRTRMTVRQGTDARSAVSHYEVIDRIESRFGKYSLVKVKIETGRTHQIRVHMSSLGHPVVGDTLYGASGRIRALPAGPITKRQAAKAEEIRIQRNFLHAAELEFAHPRTKKIVKAEAGLPAELTAFLDGLKNPA